MANVNWTKHEAGVYVAETDGLTLAVEKEDEGWVGKLDGEPVIEPAKTLKQAKAKLVKRLAEAQDTGGESPVVAEPAKEKVKAAAEELKDVTQADLLDSAVEVANEESKVKEPTDASRKARAAKILKRLEDGEHLVRKAPVALVVEITPEEFVEACAEAEAEKLVCELTGEVLQYDDLSLANAAVPYSASGPLTLGTLKFRSRVAAQTLSAIGAKEYAKLLKRLS